MKIEYNRNKEGKEEIKITNYKSEESKYVQPSIDAIRNVSNNRCGLLIKSEVSATAENKEGTLEIIVNIEE